MLFTLMAKAPVGSANFRENVRSQKKRGRFADPFSELAQFLRKLNASLSFVNRKDIKFNVLRSVKKICYESAMRMGVLHLGRISLFFGDLIAIAT